MNIPYSEQQRLAALHQLQLINSPSNPLLDVLTQLACDLFEVPIALISLVDETKQWLKSAQGIDICQTDRNISFCHHAIADPQNPLVISDAQKDPLFFENPLVKHTPFIRFYAGIPLNVFLSLQSPDGEITQEGFFCIGTFCIVDTQERTFSPEQLKQLQNLAQQALYIIQTQYNQRHHQELLCILREQKQQLQEHHQKMQSLARTQQIIIDQNPTAVLQINPQGRIVLWSPSAQQIFGFSSLEILEQTPHLITPKHHWHHVDEICSLLLQGLPCTSRTTKNITKNGQTIVCQWYCKPILDMKGQVEGALCFAEDITDLWNKERQDKQTQQTLENTIAVRDDELRQSMQALELTQAQLVESERHKAIGQTVAGIAHDINTPISNAYLLTQQLKKHLEQLKTTLSKSQVSRSCLYTDIQTIEDLRFLLETNLSSGVRLLNNFKQLSIDHVKEPMRLLDMQDLVLQNLSMLHYRMDDKMVPVYVHTYTPFYIQSYPGTIGQVLQNIFINAFEHGFLQEFSSSLFVDVLTFNPSEPDYHNVSKEQQDIVPKVQLRTLDPSIIQSVNNLKNYVLSGPLSQGLFWSPQGYTEHDFLSNLDIQKNYVYLRVCDTGKGVYPKQYQHLFEPYYSNSDQLSGSGIGLSIVKHLVETLLQGRIAIRSIPNIGFEVHLLFKHLDSDIEEIDLTQLFDL